MMKPAAGALDVGVVIGRVRVRVGPGEVRPPAAEPKGAVGARAGDHRIVVGELCVDADARLAGPEARRLGERVARALGERLAALQSRRLDAIVAGRSRGGVVRVKRLRAVLRGVEAERADVGAVVRALAGALEREVAP